MYSIHQGAVPGVTMGPAPPAPPQRLLDQVREQLRYLHYSLRTEEACVHWVRAFVRWSGAHRDVGTTMVYTHVLDFANGKLRSPLDALLPA